MTTDLPDPHACPHCGHNGLATRWGETICGMCNAPRATATPGCPVRNAMATERRLGTNHKDGCDGATSYLSGTGYNRVRVCGCGAEDHEPDLFGIDDSLVDAALVEEVFGPCITTETARERKVHGGGPRVVG